MGTGGRNFYGFSAALPNEQVRQNTTFGAMRLVLHPSSYDWSFQPVAGSTYSDAGTGSCHASMVDTVAPSVPAGLAVNGSSSSQVALGWSPSTDNAGGSGLAGYRIYRSDVSAPLNSALLTQPSFTDTSVKPNSSYSYTVSCAGVAVQARSNHCRDRLPGGLHRRVGSSRVPLR